jgi:Tfp pilus assembly protein PilZ
VVEDPAPGRPAGMGVKFVKIDRASLDAIRRFLAEQVSGEVTVGQDRRRSARLRRQVKLRFQWADSLTTSIARDISRTGVFIHTISPPPVGASVLVSLTNPVTSQKLELPGRVVRVVEPDPVQPRRLPGAGVEFVGLSEQQQEMLRRFVRDFALYNGEKSSEKNSGGQE